MGVKSTGEGIIGLALLGGAGYIAYQIYKYLKNPTNPLQTVGDKVGGAAYEALNHDAAGATATYIATTQDGSKIAVNNNAVNPSGFFTGSDGTAYQLVTNPDGTHSAVSAPDMTGSVGDSLSAGDLW